MQRLDIVEVKWEDATSSSAYQDKDQLLEGDLQLCIQFTVGFLIKKDKNVIILSQTSVPIFNEVAKLFQIPIGMVRKITVLRKAKKNEQF